MELVRLTDFELTRARPLRAGSATQRVALCEPRKRRANERPGVGCCEELARPSTDRSCNKQTNRTIKDHYFRLLGGWNFAEAP